jgi:hypothetical protein
MLMKYILTHLNITRICFDGIIMKINVSQCIKVVCVCTLLIFPCILIVRICIIMCFSGLQYVS